MAEHDTRQALAARYIALLDELAGNWEVMAEMEAASQAGRRETLRECADGLRMLADIIGRAALSAQPVAGAVAEPVTLADVLDALNVFNKPRPSEGDEPWTENDFISVKHLPDFINVIAVAWFDQPSPQTSVLAAPQPQSAPAPEPICQPNGLMFDALGEPRTRYVRVSLHGSHCVMHPSEGDTYLKDARENGDESPYVADNVWLSEREFDNLGEFDGF